MYARYNYLSTATAFDILQDIVLLLTGTTDVNLLSASCDKVNSFCLTTYNPAGWTIHDPTAYSHGTATISNATPCVVTKTSHGLAVNTPITFTTTGGLPAPLVANTVYYVSTVINANTFNISATVGGANINTTTAGSGSHTLRSSKQVVLKAPFVDNGSAYKYIKLDTVTSATVFDMQLYESWNATTRVGTNLAGDPNSGLGVQQPIVPGTAASMSIGASARYAVLQHLSPSGVGNLTYNDWTGVFERSKISPWDTVAAAYPSSVIACGTVFFGYATYRCYFPRIKNPNGTDITGLSANAAIAMMGFGSSGANYINGPAGPSSVGLQSVVVKKVPDGFGGQYTPMNEFRFTNPTYSFLGGSVSSICDIWIGPAYPLNFDETVYNNKTYIFWQNAYNSTTISSNLALLKG